MLVQISPKDLAKNGYIKFDINTGLSSDGRRIALISDEEADILALMRKHKRDRCTGPDTP